MAHKYTTAAIVISDYMPEVDGSDNAIVAIVDRLIESVSEFVDEYCKRPIEYFMPAGDTASVRNVRGRAERFLQLPKHVAGSVSIEGISDASWYEHASNGWLYYNDQTNVTDYFPAGENEFWEAGRLYPVSAIWGYAATPGPIAAATAEIVAAIFAKGRGIVGEVSPEGFIVEREIPLTARAMLKPYVRREFEIQ